jgi:hypothetical protein
MRDRFRLARAEQRGDLLVAEIGSPAELEIQGLPEPIPGGGWVQSPEQKYLGVLRQRRIRHVPMEERYAIIIALWRIFEAASDAGEQISLKEAKDRLHQWFEENQPNVPWDSINNVVYHLFWTWCFYFSEGPEDLPLWDRVTQWNVGINSAEDVIRQCDLGMVKMIVDGIGTVEPEVVCNVLGDGNQERLSYFSEICEQAIDRPAMLR